ncbi:MAG: ComEA family DNA-binding protein [bacterium]|nr:helix-hairpin-helix domain-containing protein [candidate division KSB1 bacterium]MDH7561172.1 ComEA family DNA-binding protein [bacterium]
MIAFLLVGLFVGAGVNLYMRQRGAGLDNPQALAYPDSLRREFMARAAEVVPTPAVTSDSVPTPRLVSAPARSLLAVDINRASVEELVQLPHIGPALAERIVAHRQQHGPFRSIEDIKQVRGIGERTFAKIRPYLTID